MIAVWISGVVMIAWSYWLLRVQPPQKRDAAKAVLGATCVLLLASSGFYLAGMQRTSLDPKASGAGMEYATTAALVCLGVLGGILLWNTFSIFREEERTP